MADKRIKDLTNTAAESDIASGNYFALDGSAGTKKLNSTTLLTKTAQNALGSIHSMSVTATDFASDDYIAIDGATNGSRKMKNDKLQQLVAQNSFAFLPFEKYEINKLVKELYFVENGCTASTITVSVYKNYLNSSNKYLNGLQIQIGANPLISLLEITDTAKTNFAFFLKSSNEKVFAIVDLSSLTDGYNSSTSYVVKQDLVNDLNFWPGIKSYLQDARILSDEQDIANVTTDVNKVSNCFEDLPNPQNVYDNANPNILNLYISSSGFVSSSATRLVYFKCKKNQKYVVSVDASLYHRFAAATSSQVPSTSAPCTPLFSYTAAHTTIYGRDYWECETTSDSEYIAIYYYNSVQDSADEADIRATIMVAEGEDITQFVQYSIVTRLKEGCLPQAVENIIDAEGAEDPVTSIQKIYGVEFDNSVESSSCDRIGDAVGKEFNYAVGGSLVFDHQNDFDNIFPWCEIRRCNVSGGKVVAYEGDDDFATDGTNGDVFVEIPKFYSFRKVVGTKEQICISGTPHSGFEVEPAFIDGNGNELDYIYVAVYATSNNQSKTNSLPQTLKYFDEFYDDALSKSLDVYDLAVLNAIQKLILIENADKNVSKFYEGFGQIPYYGSMQANETASGVNTFQISGSSQMQKLRVGQNVAIGANVYNDIRKITAMTTPSYNSVTSKYECSVTISGSPVDVVAGTTQFYGTQQDNGGCDAMTYHTGRAGENGLTACRYRWMENLWGNVWMQLGGVFIKDLDYYYTYDKSKYKASIDNFEKVEAFKAPEQNNYPGTIYGWITSNGFDRSNKNLILPKTIASNASDFYSAKVYTFGTTTQEGLPVPVGTELSCVCGGGWDHLDRNSPFSLRFWQYRSDNGGGRSHLYGSRFVIRSKI